MWVLASQLAVKQGLVAAGAFAERAAAAARRPGGARRRGPAPCSTRRDLPLLAGVRPTATELEAAGLAALAAAPAHRPVRDFAVRSEEDTLRLARHPHTCGHARELTARPV